MKRTRIGGRGAVVPVVVAVVLLSCFWGRGARAQEQASAASGVATALAWAAKVDVLDSSGRVLRTVNGALLQEGVVVQTASLVGATRVRVGTRDGKSWESATALMTHTMLGLSLVQLPESPTTPVTFPEIRTYTARMRVYLLNGPGVGPDSIPARIYRNFELRGFPDLCPIDTGIVGAAPAVDSTGRFLGVACDLSEGPYKFGYIVPVGSVAQLATYQAQPRPLEGLADLGRPGFEEGSTASGLLFRGAVLTQIGQLEDARRFLHLAQERDPSLSETYYWSGRALIAQQQYPQAAEELLYATEKDSTNYLVWHTAGEAQQLAGNYAAAEKMYLKAIRIKPDAADTYCTLGVAYLKMERGREAEDAWRASIRIDPRFEGGIAFYNLASTLQHASRTAAVDSICREIARVDPSWEQRLREALAKKHH